MCKLKYALNCCFVLIFAYNYCLAENDDFECIPHKQNETHLEHLWKMYKLMHNKTYSGKLDLRRKIAWIENCKFVNLHNLDAKIGKHNYTLKLNHLADMNLDTYRKRMIRLLNDQGDEGRINNAEIVGAARNSPPTPPQVDWRDHGFITLPSNQKDCGSCYAFSIAHILEAQLLRKTNQISPLSVQQIVDCSSSTGNYGCSGGSLRNTLKYIDTVGGLQSAESYPYEAKAGKCRHSSSDNLINVTKWAILPAKDEYSLERTIATVGPVAVSINASPRTFQLYHNGIYDDDGCSSNSVNHAMIVVGYTKNAWILKNWWGDRWGEKGYMRLRRHKNRCGIANYVAYATID